jgi:hypothetical protein
MTTAPRAGALLLAVALSVGLVACTDDEGPAPTTTAGPTTTTEVPLATPPEILDAGLEPRQELRLQYQPGDEIVLRTATDLAVEQDVDGQRQRLDSPPIVQLVHLTVTAVEAGTTTVALGIDGVTVDGRDTDLSAERVAALQAALDPLTQVTGSMELDELGRATAVSLEVPEAISDDGRTAIESLRAQLRQLSPSLPEEAVGVGARWRTTAPAGALAGADLDAQLAQTITLVGIEGDRLTYDATVEVLASPQDLANGAGRLTALDVTGRATGWYELGSPAQEAEVRTTGSLTIESGDEPTTVEQRTSSVVRITPQAP